MGSKDISINKPIGMQNIRRVDTCENCRHMFAQREFDCENDYYCTLGAEERPLCGSVLMDECGDPYDPEKENHNEFLARRENIRKLWDLWSADRWVFSSTICDSHEKNE